MHNTRPTLERLEVPSPCTADWNEMTGNSRVRFCEHCRKHVHNLSSMTREEAEELVRRSNGRLCVRYYHGPDGRVRTARSPGPLVRITRRASRIAAGAFSAALAVSSAAAQEGPPADEQAQVEMAATPEPAPAPEPIGGGSSSVSGTILDAQGATLPGAVMVLTNISTGSESLTTSDADGRFAFYGVPGGEYSVAATADGFNTETVGRFTIGSSEEATFELRLSREEIFVTSGGIGIVSPAYQALMHSEERDARSGEDADSEDEADEADEPPIFEAVSSGKPREIRKALRAGAYVDARAAFGDTALMRAAGDAKVLKALLRAGAFANAANDFGVTALMYAAVDGDDSVKLLLSNGADPNAADENGRTALIFAAMDGDDDVVRRLLAAGADPNARDAEGKTALGYARQYEHEEVAALLVETGATE